MSLFSNLVQQLEPNSNPRLLGAAPSPSLTAQCFMGTVFSTLAIVGLVGNILVCVAVYVNKKLRKKENLYFVSLAVADLLVTLLIMPFAASNDLMGRWHFGEYCKFWMCLDITLCTVSNLHLCAISFDRYYHIHDAMRYREYMSTRKILSALFALWTLSALIGFSPVLFDEGQFEQALLVIDDNSTRGLDSFYRCQFTLRPVYAIVSSLISFYAPCSMMIVAYAKLYKYAQRHALTIWHQLQAMTSFLVSVASQQALGEDTTCRSKWIKKRKLRGPIRGDRKARVTLGAIMGAFIIAWLPFFVSNIARSFCANCVPNWLFAACTWLGYANSAQNPIIYSVFNRDFRHTFKRILGCGGKRRRWSKKQVKMRVEQGSAVARVEQSKRTVNLVKQKHGWRSI